MGSAEYWVLFAGETVAAFGLAAAMLETLLYHSNGREIAKGSYWGIWTHGRLRRRDSYVVLAGLGLTALVGMRTPNPHSGSYPWVYDALVALLGAFVSLFLSRFGMDRELRSVEIWISVAAAVGSVVLLSLSGLDSVFLFLIWLVLVVIVTRFLNQPGHAETAPTRNQWEEYLKDTFWIAFIFGLALALYPRLQAISSDVGPSGAFMLLWAILFVAIATVIFEFVSLWMGARGRTACDEIFEAAHPGRKAGDREARRIMVAIDRHILLRDAVLLLGLVVGTFSMLLIWEVLWAHARS